MKFDEIDDVDECFFYSLFTNEVINDNSSSYINIPGGLFGDFVEQEVLIIRDAYNAILPFVEARWGKSCDDVVRKPAHTGKE